MSQWYPSYKGWIDKDIHTEYKLTEVNDEGDMVPEYSLFYLISSCSDFANEITELETMAAKMGVKLTLILFNSNLG